MVRPWRPIRLTPAGAVVSPPLLGTADVVRAVPSPGWPLSWASGSPGLAAVLGTGSQLGEGTVVGFSSPDLAFQLPFCFTWNNLAFLLLC